MLALEQLASMGDVTITKKGDQWLVEFICKDEYGFLTDRQAEWGDNLAVVVEKLLSHVATR